LTPQLFWKYRKELISSPRADLENLIKQILSSSSSSSYPTFTSPASLERKPSPVPIRRIDGRIQLASFSPSDLDALISSLSSIEPQDANVAYIVLDFSSPSVSSGVSVVDLCAVKGCVSSPENILHILASPKGKAKVDAHFLQHILPAAIPYIKSQLFSKSAKTIYILEGRGNDPGTRLDMSVGLAIAAIQLFFDGDGTLMREDRGTQGEIPLPSRIDLPEMLTLPYLLS
jgi:tRNA A64-2'-O-ribosylphosphate transferase